MSQGLGVGMAAGAAGVGAAGEATQGAAGGTQRSGSGGRARWPGRQRSSNVATQEPGGGAASASAGGGQLHEAGLAAGRGKVRRTAATHFVIRFPSSCWSKAKI